MDKIRIGLTFRAVRRAQRLRQADLASRAGVCQQTISNVERGQFGDLSIDTFLGIATALGIDVSVAISWRGTTGIRLLDRAHARLQQEVARRLLDAAWDARSEFTFNRFGERGSVDVLGILKRCRAVLIVEVKSSLVSVEETMRTLDMKTRVVPAILEAELGWRPLVVGVLLVLPEGTTHREAVARHSDSLGRKYPAQALEIRKWIEEPSGSLRGIWFLRNTTPTRVTGGAPSPDRVRRPRSASDEADRDRIGPKWG